MARKRWAIRGLGRAVGVATCAAALIAASAARIPIQAGQSQTVSLLCRVVDASGTVIPGATVDVQGSGGRSFSLVTDGSGGIFLRDIPVGRYTIRVTLVGFATQTRTVDIIPGSAASVTITMGGDLPPPPPPPPDGLLPRYHALLNPAFGGAANRVKVGTRSTVRFWISPQVELKNAELGNWPINPALVAAPGRRPLTVYLSCGFCAATSQSLPITYDGRTRRSTEAKFEILPVRVPGADAGRGEVAFTIMSAGQLMDKVTATIVVEPDDAGPSVQADANLTLPLEGGRPADIDPSLDVDVSFWLSVSGLERMIEVEVHAESVFARKQLQAMTTSVDGWIRFPTGKELGTLVQDTIPAYQAMHELVVFGPAASSANAPVLARYGLNGPPWSPGYVRTMTAQDRASVVRVLGRFGGLLYSELFQKNGNLAAVMARIETLRPPGRALRLAVASGGIVCPWPILVDPGRNDVREFWGFKYDLSVVPLALQGTVAAAPLQRPGAVPAVFAALPNDPAADSAGWLATQGLADLVQRLQPRPVLPVRTRQELLDALEQNHQDLRLLVTFVHGSAGAGQPGGVPAAGGSAGDIWLSFKVGDPQEEVTPTWLRMLPIDFKVRGDLFPAHPIVVLNACESGSAGQGTPTTAAGAVGFPYALLRLGAAGVVGTDAPVWPLFARDFAASLFTSTVKGVPMAQAVREARLDVLTRVNNPLGLIYSFHGPQNVVYRHPTP